MAVALATASMVPVVQSLPLRADMLQVNALFAEMAEGEFTDEWMRTFTGNEDLSSVNSLELQVDAITGTQRCEMIGELLPSLELLRLSESRIHTVRDLGTSLSNLKVLYLARCSLQDLGGVTNMPVLEELYVAFNDIKDLSPLWMHDALQVLDLEGNLLDDFEEVRTLQAVSTLRDLNLTMNPVCRTEGFSRGRVLEALSQLEVLDDIRCALALDSSGGLQRSCSGSSLDLYEDHSPSDGESSPARGRGREALVDLLADVPVSAEDLREEPPSRGLVELRRRAKNSEAAAAMPVGSKVALRSEAVPVVPRLPSCAPPSDAAPRRRPHAVCPRRPSPELLHCEALATLREGRLRLMQALVARGVETIVADSTTEPSERDLVVEGLKRGTRRVPSLRACTRLSHGGFAGTTPVSSRCYGALDEQKRPHSAQPSTSSGSTSYRPATASSCRSSALSACGSSLWMGGAEASAVAASDLTAGEDGAALVGTAMSAARRRRHLTSGLGSARGEDAGGLGIRGLLRCYEAAAAADELGSGCRGHEAALAAPLPGTPRGARPQTPDVRVRTQRSQSPRPDSTVQPGQLTPRPAVEASHRGSSRCGEPLDMARPRCCALPPTPRRSTLAGVFDPAALAGSPTTLPQNSAVRPPLTPRGPPTAPVSAERAVAPPMSPRPPDMRPSPPSQQRPTVSRRPLSARRRPAAGTGESIMEVVVS